MRSKLYGGMAVLFAVFATAAPGYGQGLGTPTGFAPTPGGASSEGLLDAGGLPGLDGGRNVFTAPLGDPGKPGFFTFADAVYYTGTWTLGSQTVAVRGLVDTTGQVTGLPGTLLGSGVSALNTNEFGRRSWSPGVNLGIGYKFDDGSSVTARILHTAGQTYTAGASLASPFARSGPDLADTFLVSGVFNFPPQYAGPGRKTAYEGSQISPGYTYGTTTITAPGFTLPNGVIVSPRTITVNGFTVADRFLPDGLFYGIWNGASNMVISYKTWYTEAEIGGRVPLFESSTSRVYGMGGVRYHQFMERFTWRTESYDVSGNLSPQWVANYSNTLSQRMYGPYVGCGHEVYLGKRYSLSADVSGGVFLDYIKERAKYELDDNTIANKRSLNRMQFVPTAGGNLNAWWYPVKGVQVRVGYMANTFYNTVRMSQPIGFNYGSPDPGYANQPFRLLHGLNVGVGLFF
jgi:hypothetical protein